MMKICIIVPVLNEKIIIEECLLSVHQSLRGMSDFTVFVSDAGSEDGTVQILERLKQTIPFGLALQKIHEPSIGKSLNGALLNLSAQHDAFVILPADCQVGAEAWVELKHALEMGATCGGLYKKYLSKALFLTFFAHAQNLIRLRVFRHLVFTNGI